MWKSKLDVKKLIWRWIIFLASLWVMGIGVAFAIQANLGTSPISSYPYVMSRITPLTFGQITMCMHCVLVGLQILILRKKFKWIQLIQIPVAIFFGFVSDWTLALLQHVTYQNYLQQWMLCGIGIVIIAFGVSMEIDSHATTLAGEGFVLAVCDRGKISVGNMKIVFDCSLVGLAALFSLLFLHQVIGVREGTAASMLLVGTLVKVFRKGTVKMVPAEEK